jgi:hypothetical protein
MEVSHIEFEKNMTKLYDMLGKAHLLAYVIKFY